MASVLEASKLQANTAILQFLADVVTVSTPPRGDKAIHEGGVSDGGAGDFNGADGFDRNSRRRGVAVFGCIITTVYGWLGDAEAGIRHEWSENVLTAVLFGGEDGTDDLEEMFLVVQGRNGVAHERGEVGLFAEMQSALVACEYFWCRLPGHFLNELCSLPEEFSSDCQDKVSVVSVFFFLFLTGLSEQLRRRGAPLGFL